MSDRRRLADRYVLREPPVGAGGMGTVWRAYDELLHREVAIKELRLPESLSAAEREALRERAMVEARAAAGLHHPGIVPVHDVLDEDDRPWIVMHLVEGRALDEEVAASGPLDPRRTAEIGLRLLDGLTAAHAKGVLHRDVKPHSRQGGAGDDRSGRPGRRRGLGDLARDVERRLGDRAGRWRYHHAGSTALSLTGQPLAHSAGRPLHTGAERVQGPVQELGGGQAVGPASRPQIIRSGKRCRTRSPVNRAEEGGRQLLLAGAGDLRETVRPGQ